MRLVSVRPPAPIPPISSRNTASACRPQNDSPIIDTTDTCCLRTRSASTLSALDPPTPAVDSEAAHTAHSHSNISAATPSPYPLLPYRRFTDRSLRSSFVRRRRVDFLFRAGLLTGLNRTDFGRRLIPPLNDQRLCVRAVNPSSSPLFSNFVTHQTSFFDH